MRVSGENARLTFQDEAGGHRIQRVPANDKRGRVQSSTITVAVLDIPTEQSLHIDPKDLEVKTCRSGGKGGQNVNKVESCVIVTHRSSGLQVRCESERSQTQNKATAMDLLRAKLLEAQRAQARVARDAARRQQVGSGERSDKRRTVRMQDDSVVDHVTGRRWRASLYWKGQW